MLKWVTLHCVLGYAQVRAEDNNGVTGEHIVCTVDKPMIQVVRKYERFFFSPKTKYSLIELSLANNYFNCKDIDLCHFKVISTFENDINF